MREHRRSVSEVFASHLALRKQGRVDEDIATNYSPEVVLLTLSGVYRGHAGVRACANELQCHLPEADFRYKVRLVEGDIAYLAWSGRSPAGAVRDGADTFLIRDGWIVVQTIHYNVDGD
jgi:hypothetical protein